MLEYSQHLSPTPYKLAMDKQSHPKEFIHCVALEIFMKHSIVVTLMLFLNSMATKVLGKEKMEFGY